MKKQLLIGLVTILIELVFLAVGYHHAIAKIKVQYFQPSITAMDNLPAPQALQSTPTPDDVGSSSPTPEPRVLPAVGANAGLVLGATVLVLIIIIGVIISSAVEGKTLTAPCS